MDSDTQGNFTVDRFIPLSVLCKNFGCDPRTMAGVLKRHGIALTELSRSKRGLLLRDYETLIARARKQGVAA